MLNPNENNSLYEIEFLVHIKREVMLNCQRIFAFGANVFNF